MKTYIVIMVSKHDYCDRYWVKRNTLEEAKALASQYTFDNTYTVEIHEIGPNLL